MNSIIAFSLSASSFSVAMICVIALVTNSWLVVQSSVTLISGEIGFITVPKGLWLDQDSGALFAVKILMIFGILCTIAASGYFVIIGFRKHDKPAIAVWLLVISGLSIGISLVVYTVYYNPETVFRSYFGYSYVIGWISDLGIYLVAMVAAMFH